ncbi:MAG: hypothetical protein A2008_03990 [Candidatus Wallbacteria bacterium GWC2_49_35]|uniref:Uncharacterized protein n=1 Tax=Candidatus Wallbacteria bacterium GWC2_49_35 TaxID=1817813 RepID=A0A1F7WUJ8_9BACT|nr:MAG: hypothetical protein A2008_03990 [Candidatus Wallbacteria bacterium GWC2_49_35]HBC73340.1 hypothetical protein [Candidatus Wallbacteria bacterium]
MNANKNLIMFMALLLLCAFTAVFPGAAAFAGDSLNESEMVILRPHKTGPTDSLVYMKDSSGSDINKILRDNPEFIKQVRLYQSIQKEKFAEGLKKNFRLSDAQLNKILAGYKPDPVYMVLNEGMVTSVSFANSKPFGVLEIGADGKTSLSVKAAPLVTLSADTINELKTGDRWGYETVCHEIGHVIMYPTHGMLAYPHDLTENLIEKIKKEGHWKNKVTTPTFAMLEGWAEFNGAFFTGRPIGDYTRIDGRAKTEDEMIRTEGLVAKIMLDISMNAEINADKDKGYEKIMDTMRAHKCRTLNSFLVDYVKDYPADRAVVEKIVKNNTGGTVTIDYDYGFKDWWADKSQDLKKTFAVVKDWFTGLFKKKDKTAAASSMAGAATIVPAPIRSRTLVRDEKAPAFGNGGGALKLSGETREGESASQTSEFNKKWKSLYEEYKKALAENNDSKASEILEEIKALNGKIK